MGASSGGYGRTPGFVRLFDHLPGVGRQLLESALAEVQEQLDSVTPDELNPDPGLADTKIRAMR